MKTNQIMERSFLGGVIKQEHKTGYFCMNDFLEIANKYRRSVDRPLVRWDKYHKSEKTKEFIQQLIREEDTADVVRAGRGRGAKTWLHPLVFLDFAMWVSPEFKIKVYKWLYDNLLAFRDMGGDSYKQMASIIQNKHGAGKVGMMIKETARKIKDTLGVLDWNRATEKQNKYREEIHSNIILLIEADIDLQIATAMSLRKAVNKIANRGL